MLDYVPRLIEDTGGSPWASPIVIDFDFAPPFFCALSVQRGW